MIAREDVVCAIGYDGNAALVDRGLRKKLGGSSTDELLADGQFRAADASALYSGSAEEVRRVADAYNGASGSNYTPEAIPRLFGVGRVSVQRTLAL